MIRLHAEPIATAGGENDAMIALNAAFASDGVVVFVPDNCAPAKPFA